jgi:hypothetical protein
MSILARLVTNTKETRKFFLYALGELILIVAGIYIALQLDDWKNARDRHHAEIEILDEIAAGFEKDIGDLKFNISLHESAIRSGNKVIQHFENNLPYSDSLSIHFATILWYSRLTANDGPFENLKSKGLDLVTNDTLRSSITSMYDIMYEALRQFEEDTFLPDSYILSVCATRFDKTEIYIPLPNRDFAAGRMVPYDYEKLRQDPDYVHVVKSLVSKNNFLVNYFMLPMLSDLTALKNQVQFEGRRLREIYE